MAWALMCALVVVGFSAPSSATTDAGAPVTKMTEQEMLIAQALELGLITEADLIAPSSATLVAAAPTVTAVAPTGGPVAGGQIVALTGTAFTGATAVKFGETDATSYAVVSATRIVAKVPANTAGAKAVKVTNADGTNSTGSTYLYGAPTVTAVAPAFADPTAEAGAVITITGTGFLGAEPADVTFGELEALEVFVVSDTQIVATTPIDDEEEEIEVERGVTNVVVTRNSIASSTTAASKFLFSPGVPVVTTLGTVGTPVTGTNGAAVGQLLTITGTNLWGINKVNFGATPVIAPAEIVATDPDGETMTVKVPTRTPGPVDVTVENIIGASKTNLSTRFTYIGTVAPTVTSVTPNVLDATEEDGGGTFLVTGTGFSGVTTAKVTLKCTTDITPTTVVVVSDTSLIVTAPGNADDTAEACNLEIVNAVDNTKKVTSVGAVRYV